jgi:structural maintenance of chromosome 2
MSAMKFVFGPYMVCDTPETAKQITFHPNVRVKTVTKELLGISWDITDITI